MLKLSKATVGFCNMVRIERIFVQYCVDSLLAYLGYEAGGQDPGENFSLHKCLLQHCYQQ